MPGLSDGEIAAIENEIGISLPAEVKQAFARDNGLRGPTDIWLLFPHSADPNEDIVRMNKMLKAEDWFPEALLTYAIVGTDGTGGLICVKGDGQEASIWYPAEGEHFHERRSSVGEIWQLIRQLYAETDEQLDPDRD